MSLIADIVSAAVSPANKLIECVSSAIGKAYEPTHIRRMAKARAYEIEEVSRALRENADIPIQYDKGEISADTKDFDEFVKRAQSRIAYQELLKQKNIECVADKAYSLLEEETECSQEPVDTDWLSRFFNSVESISDSDMQLLWAKILAGEVKEPKTYSLRTLETLKNLSKGEALLFQKLAPYVFTSRPGKYIISYPDILKKFSINYSDIVLLSECGLLSSTELMGIRLKIDKEPESNAIYTEKSIIFFESKTLEEIEVEISVYKLTTAGKELFELVQKEYNNEYILELAEKIYNKYKKDINIKICEVNRLTNESLEYEDVPIKEFNS